MQERTIRVTSIVRLKETIEVEIDEYKAMKEIIANLIERVEKLEVKIKN